MPELRWDDPDRRNPLMPRWDVAVRDKLLDSSNMTPGDWFAIASHIRDLYAERDGFVILHGTDTMAYTASALAFMLEGLAKPVVLTGSQVPLAEVRNDARENLITALMIAGNYGLERPEVCLYVGRRLLRGCRAVKVSADGFGAFDSPNSAAAGDGRRRHRVQPPRPAAAGAAPGHRLPGAGGGRGEDRHPAALPRDLRRDHPQHPPRPAPGAGDRGLRHRQRPERRGQPRLPRRPGGGGVPAQGGGGRLHPVPARPGHPGGVRDRPRPRWG